MTIPAYPLQWPTGWQRTPIDGRAYGRFGKQETRKRSWSDSTYRSKERLSIADAVGRVRRQLASMGVVDDDLVISTNLALRLDGLPRSGQPEPKDAGAAVYWQTRDGATRCMAIDRYQRVADNLAAIAATLDAMRAIERHGGAEILDRAFTGFAALPDQSEDWRAVLGVPAGAPRAAVDEAYRRLRAAAHPDRGGSPEAFQRVQRAYERATA